MAQNKHRWYKFVLATFVSALSGLIYWSQLFSLLTPDHWCRDLDVETLQIQLPLLPEEGKKFSIPPATLPGGSHRLGFSQCEKYGGDLVGAYVVWISARRPEHRETGAAISCNQGWIYNHTTLFPTIPSLMNWVCDSRWKPHAIHAAFWLASACGVPLWSSASLRVGRALSLLLALTLYLLGGLGTLLASGFFSILLSKIVAGISHLAIRHQSLLLALEASDAKESPLVLAVILVAYTMASLVTTFTAILVTSWWWLTLIAVLPTILCMMMTARLFLKESPRKIIHVPPNEGILAFHVSDSIKIMETMPNVESTDIEEKPRHRAVVLNIIWMSSCVCYFGLSHNAPTLVSASLGARSTDVAVLSSCWYAALMEVPCWGLPLMLPSSWRRRWIIGISLAMSAILIVSPALVPTGTSSMGFLSLSLLARLVATAAFYTVLQHRMENSVRGRNGQIAAETLGGLSIAFIPLIASVAEFSPSLPSLIIGSAALLGAFASLWLADGGLKPMATYNRLSSWLHQIQVSSTFSKNKEGNDTKFEDSSLPYKPLEC